MSEQRRRTTCPIRDENMICAARGQKCAPDDESCFAIVRAYYAGKKERYLDRIAKILERQNRELAITLKYIEEESCKETKTQNAKGLKAIRKERGVSQTELAGRLGVKQNTVSQWEKGRREPSVRMLVRMSEELECSISDLVQGESHT